MMMPMPVMPWMMRHHGVAVRPIVAIVAAIGVRIARPEVLTICVRVELRTIAGVFDNGLRQRGSCESRRGKSSGTYYSEFHSGLSDHFGLLDGVGEHGNAPSIRQFACSLAPSNVIVRHRGLTAADAPTLYRVLSLYRLAQLCSDDGAPLLGAELRPPILRTSIVIPIAGLRMVPRLSTPVRAPDIASAPPRRIARGRREHCRCSVRRYGSACHRRWS